MLPKRLKEESFNMSRRMIREEGLLCGGSSGSAMYSAIKAIKDLNIGKGKRVVVILADSTRNYMSKFLSADWMRNHRFLDEEDEADTSTQTNEPWAKKCDKRCSCDD